MFHGTPADNVRLRDEHDDDLESTVHEEAEEETESFPATADDFEDDEEAVHEGELPIDEDETEL